MKTDPTTKVLLGVIATGVAALTALAFEKRYHNHAAAAADDIRDAAGNTYERISRHVRETGREVRQETASQRDRFEDGVEHLREKAGAFKERVSDSLDRAGNHLQAGAEKLKDSLQQGAEAVKDGADEASGEARRALDGARI